MTDKREAPVRRENHVYRTQLSPGGGVLHCSITG